MSCVPVILADKSMETSTHSPPVGFTVTSPLTRPDLLSVPLYRRPRRLGLRQGPPAKGRDQHRPRGTHLRLGRPDTDAANGKSYLAQELENYWISIGLQVRRLTYDEDFLAEDSRFIMAKDIKDICPDILPNEIAIIEYPNLDDNSIPSGLLNMGTINLLVTRANRTWKDVDQKALKELQSQLTDQNTLYMYLTEAQRYAVEEFVGQLPPYTKFNNFVYRMSQMGLTAVENSHAK